MGNTLRYRPVYFVSLFIQSLVFGFTPLFYFIYNAFLLGVGLYFLGLASRRFFAWPITISLIISCLALGYNNDLWLKLGPAEREGFTWSMIFLWALIQVDRYRVAWPLACVMCALAIGEKEILLIYLLPLLLGAIKKVKIGKYWELLWLIIPVGMAIPVFFTCLRVLRLKTDIYSENLEIGTLLNSIFPFFKGKIFIFWLSTSIFYGILGIKKYLKIKIWRLELYNLLLLILMIACVIFYSGKINFTIENRYGFPYAFLFLLMIYILIYIVGYDVIREIKKRCAYNVIVLFMTVIISASPILKLVVKNERQAYVTAQFNNFMNQLQGFQRAIIVPTDNIIETYEPYFSLNKFHKAGFMPEVQYLPYFKDTGNQHKDNLTRGLKSRIKNQQIKIDEKTVLITSKFSGNNIIYNAAEPFIPHDKLFCISCNFHKDFNYIDIYKSCKIILPYRNDIEAPKEIVIMGEFKDSSELSFLINGQRVGAKYIIYNTDSITINLDEIRKISTSYSPFFVFEINFSGVKDDKIIFKVSGIYLK